MTTVIGVLGASGRAGSLVVKCLKEFPDFKLGAALVAADCPTLGTTCLSANENQGLEVKYSSNMQEAVLACDAFIDFSSPKSSLALARLCAQKKIAHLVATTGLNDEQVNELSQLAKNCPILLTPNTSLGVFALKEVSLLAQRILGEKFEVEVFEIHHNKKKDAPSGTALSLGKSLAQQGELKETMRAAGERCHDQIGYSVARGGDVPGEHTVFFFGKGERLEITHRASDRAIFARGALEACSKLIQKSAGLYSMNDLY